MIHPKKTANLMFNGDKFPARKAAERLLSEEASMREQRQFARKTLSCTVSVFDHHSNEYIGLMVDYSRGGVMISSPGPLPVEQEFTFKMVDIEPRQNVKRSGSFVATSVWTDKINSTMYGTGFRISDVSQEAQLMFTSYDRS